MSDKPDPKEDQLNRTGPAGETADPFVGRIVSGQPAGGSDDLDSKKGDDDQAPQPSP